MIKVTIELHSARTGEITTLGKLDISLVGGDDFYGDYDLTLVETSYGGVRTKRAGRLTNWRRARGAVCLVRDAIAALF